MGLVSTRPHPIVPTKCRQTQIYQGELLAALSATHCCEGALRGQRFVHFVDNQKALSSLVGGCAPDDDSGAITCLYQLAVARANARVWFEHVESPAIVSDGASRDGKLGRCSADRYEPFGGHWQLLRLAAAPRAYLRHVGQGPS